MMKNKGQITAFVLLGLVILALAIIFAYIFLNSSKNQEPYASLTLEQNVEEVKARVMSCLESSLPSAVKHCASSSPLGGSKCPNYESDLANKVKEDFCSCIPGCSDFSEFKNVQVESKGEIKIEADLTENKEKITIAMKYPIMIKKGDTEKMIGTAEQPFITQYSLKQSECVPIKLKGDDHTICQADEDKTVEVLGVTFTFKQGDRVAVGDNCVAC
ncbi:hypothetical protein FJZ53_07320 [Candidatus Woesearchaeota archaeon]|nr:hypothetical protein [Candidatus Woesearchaeota archaeon]